MSFYYLYVQSIKFHCSPDE